MDVVEKYQGDKSIGFIDCEKAQERQTQEWIQPSPLSSWVNGVPFARS